MHKCKNCGKEFDGNFCPECGEKFVENAVCPKCGAKTEADDKFCSVCGEKLAAVTGQPAAVQAQVAVSKDRTTGEWIKYALYLSGIICIILAAVMGLAFTFACGVSAKSGNATGATRMLYDYFGNAYNGINEARSELLSKFEWDSIGGAREFALYFPVVLGTVISAVGILVSVILSAVTAYKAYQKFYNKKEVNVIAPAVATYLNFAALATLLLVLNSTGAAGAKTTFSDATLGGLITGGVLLGLGLLLVAGSNYKIFKSFNAEVGGITAVAVSVFAVVLVALTVLPVVGMSFSYSGYSLKLSFGMFTSIEYMLESLQNDTIYEIIAYGTVGGCLMIALAIISLVILYRKITGLSDGKNKSCLALGIVSVILAVACLVFSILLTNAMWGESEETVKYLSKDYAVPIAILVMSVLALACEIAGRVVIAQKGETVSVQAE